VIQQPRLSTTIWDSCDLAGRSFSLPDRAVVQRSFLLLIPGIDVQIGGSCQPSLNTARLETDWDCAGSIEARSRHGPLG
jgi:hypothetical protein